MSKSSGFGQLANLKAKLPAGKEVAPEVQPTAQTAKKEKKLSFAEAQRQHEQQERERQQAIWQQEQEESEREMAQAAQRETAQAAQRDIAQVTKKSEQLVSSAQLEAERATEREKEELRYNVYNALHSLCRRLTDKVEAMTWPRDAVSAMKDAADGRAAAIVDAVVVDTSVGESRAAVIPYAKEAAQRGDLYTVWALANALDRKARLLTNRNPKTILAWLNAVAPVIGLPENATLAQLQSYTRVLFGADTTKLFSDTVESKCYSTLMPGQEVAKAWQLFYSLKDKIARARRSKDNLDSDNVWATGTGQESIRLNQIIEETTPLRDTAEERYKQSVITEVERRLRERPRIADSRVATGLDAAADRMLARVAAQKEKEEEDKIKLAISAKKAKDTESMRLVYKEIVETLGSLQTSYRDLSDSDPKIVRPWPKTEEGKQKESAFWFFQGLTWNAVVKVPLYKRLTDREIALSSAYRGRKKALFLDLMEAKDYVMVLYLSRPHNLFALAYHATYEEYLTRLNSLAPMFNLPSNMTCEDWQREWPKVNKEAFAAQLARSFYPARRVYESYEELMNAVYDAMNQLPVDRISDDFISRDSRLRSLKAKLERAVAQDR